MTSPKKIAANQNNAKHSSGARTEAGKERAKMNAKTHGIFAKELLIPDKDKPQFEVLRSSLGEQLKPASVLQQIAFEKILASCWRYKLATRLEMKRLDSQLASTEDTPRPEPQSQTAAQDPMSNWYASSAADLRKAKKLLVELGQDVAKNGWIHKEDWRNELTNTFGNECFNLLTAWDPESVDAILLAKQIVEHSKVHGSRLPLPLSTEDLGKENGSQESVTKESVTKKGAGKDAVTQEGESKNLVVDLNANWQMSVKLIDLLRLHVEGFMRIKGLAAEGLDERHSANTLDLGARYATTATRDLERAVLWFQYLKDQNL